MEEEGKGEKGGWRKRGIEEEGDRGKEKDGEGEKDGRRGEGWKMEVDGGIRME